MATTTPRPLHNVCVTLFRCAQGLSAAGTAPRDTSLRPRSASHRGYLKIAVKSARNPEPPIAGIELHTEDVLQVLQARRTDNGRSDTHQDVDGDSGDLT